MDYLKTVYDDDPILGESLTRSIASAAAAYAQFIKTPCINTFKYDEEKVVLDKYTIIELDRTSQLHNVRSEILYQVLSGSLLEIERIIN